MAISLGQGAPLVGTIVRTDPLQLRFQLIADQAYTIRLVYVPNPTDITSDSQTVTVPEEHNEGLYLKFRAMVARDMGNQQLAQIAEHDYREYVRQNGLHFKYGHKKRLRLNFSWA